MTVETEALKEKLVRLEQQAHAAQYILADWRTSEVTFPEGFFLVGDFLVYDRTWANCGSTPSTPATSTPVP